MEGLDIRGNCFRIDCLPNRKIAKGNVQSGMRKGRPISTNRGDRSHTSAPKTPPAPALDGMMAEERRTQILQIVRSEGRARVNELASRFSSFGGHHPQRSERAASAWLGVAFAWRSRASGKDSAGIAGLRAAEDARRRKSGGSGPSRRHSSMTAKPSSSIRAQPRWRLRARSRTSRDCRSSPTE